MGDVYKIAYLFSSTSHLYNISFFILSLVFIWEMTEYSMLRFIFKIYPCLWGYMYVSWLSFLLDPNFLSLVQFITCLHYQKSSNNNIFLVLRNPLPIILEYSFQSLLLLFISITQENSRLDNIVAYLSGAKWLSTDTLFI